MRIKKGPRWIEDTAGCWLWTGGRAGKNLEYGKGKRTTAHREVYEEFNGPLEKHITLDHLCRVKLCVNPSHLEPVTNRENKRPAGQVKLSLQDEVQIKTEYSQGIVTQKYLGEYYGVTEVRIWQVLNNRCH